MRKLIAGLVAGVVMGSALAYAGGFLTNGYPFMQPSGTVNGVATTFPNNVVTNPTAAMLVPVDTQLTSGQVPQSVAETTWQIASLAAETAASAATSTAGAATLNTRAGTVTTEALTTAVAATYSFTLTNSLITATGPAPQVAVYSKSNTAGTLQLTSVTNAAGSSVFVFTNVGTAALNGTLIIAFHI